MPLTREQESERARKHRRDSQDIGPAPPLPEDETWLQLRLESDESLIRHFEICYPMAFPMAWSDDHRRLIADIERAADVGLLKALAMPRGSGKTTIMMRAGLWALLTARRRFCTLVAATDFAARQLLKGIKTEITYNEHLGRMYPRELHAMKSLENEPLRSRGQRVQGELTGVEWVTEKIAFGTVPGVETSGAILTTCGLTGNIRGQQAVTKDGNVIRPDLALIDDPQTKDSAGSETQSQTRHETMMGDILGLAGPDRDIAAVTTCTVIYQGDLADRLLNRDISPDWQGDKCQLVNQWPTNEQLWDKYAAIRADELKAGGDGSQATAFYVDHREDMDAGAVVSWPERKGSAVSAIQYAYNLRFRDEAAFYSEYQNDPLKQAEDIPFDLNVNDISRRTINTQRNEIPPEAEVVTAFVDVQKEVLFYVLMAFTPGGRGCVIDYGSFPDQQQPYFTKSRLRFKLSHEPGVNDLSEATYHGLEQLTGDLFSRRLLRADGTVFGIDVLAIDAGYSESRSTVRRFCVESEHSSKLFPSFGQYLGANQQNWQQMHVGKHARIGEHCRLDPPPKRQWGNRELKIDVNWWKTWCAERLTSSIGGDRAIVLYDDNPANHRMFAENCCSEDPVVVTAKDGTRQIEWKQNPGKPNNDFWDCLIGASCLASLHGVEVLHQAKKPKKGGRLRTLGKVQFGGKVRK